MGLEAVSITSSVSWNILGCFQHYAVNKKLMVLLDPPTFEAYQDVLQHMQPLQGTALETPLVFNAI